MAMPLEITTAPLRTVRPADLTAVYTEPTTQLKRWVHLGRMNKLAWGLYYALPDDEPGPWLPTMEAATVAAATALYGERVPVLMHLTAARLHGAVPRALGVGIVAVPGQHAPLRLIDRPHGTVLFVKRDVDRLDATLQRTDLGPALATTAAQTVVDLAKRPDLGEAPDQVEGALRVLLRRCDMDEVEDLARQQRAGRVLGELNKLLADELRIA